jgi:hypothetical protein
LAILHRQFSKTRQRTAERLAYFWISLNHLDFGCNDENGARIDPLKFAEIFNGPFGESDLDSFGAWMPAALA